MKSIEVEEMRREEKVIVEGMMRGMNKGRSQEGMMRGRMWEKTIIIVGRARGKTNTDKEAVVTAKTTVSTPANGRVSNLRKATTLTNPKTTTTAPNNTIPKPQLIPTCTATTI